MNTVIVSDTFLKNTKHLGELSNNERYVVTKEKITKTKPNFLMIGKGIEMRNENGNAIDLLKEVSNMNANEKFAFFALRDAMNYTDETLSNISVSQKDFKKYDKKMFQAGTNALIERNLIARVKRGLYQFNPYAIIPSDFDKAKELWDSIKKDQAFDMKNQLHID